MDFEDIRIMVYREYIKNGYNNSWTSNIGDMLVDKFIQLRFDIAEVGLITTEVSEALEDIREDKISELGVELADIIIRTLNFASRKGIDIESEIIKKHHINLNREKLHGKKV